MTDFTIKYIIIDYKELSRDTWLIVVRLTKYTNEGKLGFLFGYSIVNTRRKMSIPLTPNLLCLLHEFWRVDTSPSQFIRIWVSRECPPWEGKDHMYDGERDTNIRLIDVI